MIKRLFVCACTMGITLAAGIADAQEYHQAFRVMTYNVRHVTNDDTGQYAWSARSSAVMETIAVNDPDIFGVQESSSQIIQDDLVAAFDADYDRYQPPNGSPKTIFFKRSRFRRIETDEVEGFFGIPNPYQEGAACHSNASGRTAAWVKLEDLQSARGYLVVNVHVAHGAACGAARNAAAERLHTLFAEQSEGLSIVLIGDLNSDPQRASGHVPEDRVIELLEAPQRSYRLLRSARHGTTNASTATFNSAWKQPSTSHLRLDYIFTSIADATTYHPAVDRREVGGISPSDHFPVLATIRHAPFAPDPIVDVHDADHTSRLAFADVNGDGLVDKLTWSTTPGALRVAAGDGTGRFEDPVLDPTPTAAGESLFFADVNGDGCADRIAWGNAIEEGRLRVFLSSCDGTFSAQAQHSPGRQVPGTGWMFARIDDDPCEDRIAWDPSDGKARVALSTCDGSFGAELPSDDDAASSIPEVGIALADVTGDGLADKIAWDPTAFDGRTRIFAGNGDGTFSFLTDHTSGTSGVATSRFHYADIDGDGHADKLFWRDDFRQGHIQLYMGHADGFDAHPIMVNAGVSESPDARYFFADVDANGSSDLILSNLSEHPGETHVHLALVAQPQPEVPDDEDPNGEDDGGSGTDDGDGVATTQSDSDTGGEPSDPDAHGGDASGCGCRTEARDDGTPLGLCVLLAVAWARTRRPRR